MAVGTIVIVMLCLIGCAYRLVNNAGYYEGYKDGYKKAYRQFLKDEKTVRNNN